MIYATNKSSTTKSLSVTGGISFDELAEEFRINFSETFILRKS